MILLGGLLVSGPLREISLRSQNLLTLGRLVCPVAVGWIDDCNYDQHDKVDVQAGKRRVLRGRRSFPQSQAQKTS